MIVYRRTHTDRQTYTLITILRFSSVGAEFDTPVVIAISDYRYLMRCVRGCVFYVFFRFKKHMVFTFFPTDTARKLKKRKSLAEVECAVRRNKLTTSLWFYFLAFVSCYSLLLWFSWVNQRFIDE